MAAAAEGTIHHPIAQALRLLAEQHQLSTEFAITDAKSHLGRGVTASVDDDAIAVGNRQLMTEQVAPSVHQSKNSWRRLWLAVKARCWSVGMVRSPLWLRLVTLFARKLAMS